MLDTLQARGVASLGGALFPTHLKLARRGLDTLVVNGAECEPYITCDDRLMRERASGIVAGIALAAQLTEARQVLINIEDNKPQAIAAMRAACAGSGFDVVVIPPSTPAAAPAADPPADRQGGAAGRRSTEFGVQCLNVATLYTAARALEHGEPAIQRLVTLTGAVARPGQCRSAAGHAGRLAAGRNRPPGGQRPDHHGRADDGLCPARRQRRPHPGQQLPDCRQPDAVPPRPPAMPCIRCGDCAQVCPAELQPMDLHWFAKARQFDKARDAHLFDCIECGACSYVCPSQIPLVDYYRFAKSELWASDRDKKPPSAPASAMNSASSAWSATKPKKAERLAQRSRSGLRSPAQHSHSRRRPSADDAGKRAAIEVATMARAAARQTEQNRRQADSAASAAGKRRHETRRHRSHGPRRRPVRTNIRHKVTLPRHCCAQVMTPNAPRSKPPWPAAPFKTNKKPP